jgi:hypothetical protein
MLAAWVVCALGPAIVGAQGQKEPEAPTPFKALKYRSIGPAAGGRVSRVAGVAGDPTIYYAATASGGVWKSTDAGATWKPVFDDQPVSSMGSIAVAPSDPNVVYVGSGEANIRGNVAAGNGIYKSMDAGKTWTHVWKQEGQIVQFYHVSADTRRPYHVAGAMQDLGTAQGPSMTLSDGISLDDWYSVGGGEAGHVVSDWSDPNIVYAGEYLGIITRYDHRGCRSAWKCGAVGPRSAVVICAACARRHFEADRSCQSHPLRPRTGSGPRQVARGAEI